MEAYNESNYILKTIQIEGNIGVTQRKETHNESYR